MANRRIGFQRWNATGRRRRAAAAAAIALLAVPASASAQGAGSPCRWADLQPAPETIGQVEAAMLCLINERRAHSGLPPLRRSGQLDRSAGFHSADMVHHRYFAHHRRGRPRLLTRIMRTGYFDGARDGLYTENIGYGPEPAGTARALVDAWMRSRSHRVNTLNAEFADIGIGSTFVGPDPAFWPDRPSTVYTIDFVSRVMRPPGRAGSRRTRRSTRRCSRRRGSARVRAGAARQKAGSCRRHRSGSRRSRRTRE